MQSLATYIQKGKEEREDRGETTNEEETITETTNVKESIWEFFVGAW